MKLIKNLFKNNDIDVCATSEREESSKVENLRVKLFTHTDISGAMCSVVAQSMFSDVDVEYCHNKDVNDAINTFIIIDKKYTDYDLLLIGDVHLNPDTVTTINMLHSRFGDSIGIRYYNHQNCNLWINECSWARVQDFKENLKLDSSAVMLDSLSDEFNIKPNGTLIDLVEKSRSYTTWDWVESNDTDANILNLLCHDGAIEVFVSKLLAKIDNNLDIIDSTDIINANYIEGKYQKYLTSKKQDLILKKISVNNNIYRVGFVMAEQYISKLGDDLNSIYNQLDGIIVMSNFKELKFRASKTTRLDISELAAMFSGGGSFKSAAAVIPVEIQESLIDTLIDEYQCR